MKHTLLLSLFLVPVSAIQAMEIVVGSSDLDEKVYTFFTNNQQVEAKKILPRDEAKIASLFVYGVKKNNVSFMQWLLTTEKPLFDSLPLQEALKLSRSYDREKIKQLLENYHQTEHDKLQQELAIYVQNEIAKIEKLKTPKKDCNNYIENSVSMPKPYEKVPSVVTDKQKNIKLDPECKCIII